jgi:integrating conjugative element protein (TIGR03746 family)
MSGIEYLHALASERQHARMLRSIIVVVAVIGVISTWLAWRTPKIISIHLLPNISADSTVVVQDGQSSVPPQNVYSFAYYIWQQINHWSRDGSVDYSSQIRSMRAYLTPRCQAQLAADEQARAAAGELRNRTRTIQEIAGLGYAPNRVVDHHGTGQIWTVFLDSQIQETFQGTPVKDVLVRFPIQVVRYDVDRERNPWQLGIDCYGNNQPARLSEADVYGDSRRSEIKTPTLPSAIAPAQLPQATQLEQTTNIAPTHQPAEN